MHNVLFLLLGVDICSIMGVAVFIVKPSPVSRKIYVLVSGTNVHRQGDVLKLYSRYD